MVVYLNGRFVREEEAVISIDDRGFLYGDGLFETIRVYERELFLWPDHIKRWLAGCKALRIISPLSPNELLRVCWELLDRNQMKNAMLRITLSRGRGMRGYSPRGADHPTLVIAAYAPITLPKAYRVITASEPVAPQDALSGFKHPNRLRSVLARAEADEAGAQEALMLDTRGHVMEGTSTNVFWITGGTICTPPLDGVLGGTTRAHILRLCDSLGIPQRQRRTALKPLLNADGVFLTSCGIEVMEVSHINGHRLRRSKITEKLKRHYRAQ